MKTLMGFLSVAVLALVLPACSFKATTKETTDTTSNVTGSTSGKSWFDGGLVKNDQKVNVFAHLNFENLKQDMAAGQGEYLAALSSLMGIAPDRQAAFFSLTQMHYTTLLHSDRTTPDEMLVALHELLAPRVASN